MTIVHRPTPHILQAAPAADADSLYQRALELAFGTSRRKRLKEIVYSRLYWIAIILSATWLGVMAVDRTPPVEVGQRTVVNVGGKVQPGEQLLIKSTRRRHRVCGLVRRIYVLDGRGKRTDYEPAPFDAYGPATRPEDEAEAEITGPFIPLDAAPGRGRSVTILSHECNPVHRALNWPIVTILPHVEFEIVGRSAPR